MPFGPTALSWLVVLALLLALAGLGLAVLALSRVAAGSQRGAPRLVPGRRDLHGLRRRNAGEPLSPAEATAAVETLTADGASAMRHVAVVRYDAFGDMGGHLSWSFALLNDLGDGVVLTSIHGRSDSRTYAKNISAWLATQQLSPEEEEAVGLARTPQ